WNAVEAIGQLGRGVKDVTTQLKEALKDQDIRLPAAMALGNLGADAKVAVPELIKALNPEDRLLCLEAAEALGKIGSEAHSAVPALIRLRNGSTDQSIQDAAAEALVRIQATASAHFSPWDRAEFQQEVRGRRS